mgnify:CR=1 FL=1
MIFWVGVFSKGSFCSIILCTLANDATLAFRLLRSNLNANVASFAKVHKIIEQKEPFEKTPTQKIKRFLYQ